MKARPRWLPYHLILRNLCLSLAMVAATVVLIDQVYRSRAIQTAQLEALKRLLTYQVMSSAGRSGF